MGITVCGDMGGSENEKEKKRKKGKKEKGWLFL
jgi:hypothetical protein